MQRSPVKSSNIAAVGYDVGSQVLEIEFTNGTVYTYAKVPPEIHLQMLEAKSVGSFFSYAVRGKFESTKVPQEPKPEAVS